MNTVNNFPDAIPEMYGFRPQQGLLIMNFHAFHIFVPLSFYNSFRPQQGLLIMNKSLLYSSISMPLGMFPSPTGATYYESLPPKP